jgi:hypothetical protein
MKKIGILLLTFLVFYHIPLEVYSASFINHQNENKPVPKTNTSHEFFFDISDDVVCDPLLHDSEFKWAHSDSNYLDQNSSLKSNLKFYFLLSIPFHLLSQSFSDIVLKSILAGVKFCIPDSSLISLLGNHFSFRL